jgi:hypothetical protein
MTALLVAVLLVIGGFIAIAVGAIAGADPQGRGGRVLAWCWGLGVLAIFAGLSLFGWWWRAP